ncbi:MAG: uridine diphosphate-N-acetylglucosamine-binding protein YvcK [Anaerolineae bacterium]|nr:uridine diphosphate-N-acetylglucosamine-binding protein YvcK [Anaerolineae bacterium]
MMILQRFARLTKIGLGVKRWIALVLAGVVLLIVSIGLMVAHWPGSGGLAAVDWQSWAAAVVGFAVGLVLMFIGQYRLVGRFVEPFRPKRDVPMIDALYEHSQRSKGLKIVALGGGTGMPSVLRGLKQYTRNITAVVTVADDGGSSGRLRREMGVLPPGDLRNNIVALADDESSMARLFQYRFESGDLKGHAFGNLFISALSAVSGGLESALVETADVLKIQGRVFPSTLQDVVLAAWVRPHAGEEPVWTVGESKITEMGGKIEQLCLEPADAEAYPGSVDAILNASIVIIGPGSLFTSILPNLLVPGIADALRATSAEIVYVCNVATQPGETDAFTVADHVHAIEKHIGRGVFGAVLANNHYPTMNAGANTIYVQPVPPNHDVLKRYEFIYTDLVNAEKPWRHDPNKLAQAIMTLRSDSNGVN